MKYRPTLPEHNDNVSHQKPLREFLLILCGLSALALVVFWVLGLLLDAMIDRMSPETEARLHQALAAQAGEPDPAAPALQTELQRMTDALQRCAGVKHPVSLTVLKSAQPNAAVLPGGHIVVFAGLLDHVQSRNGLSFVLAHELEHLKNRDHLRGFGRTLLLIAITATLTGAHSDLTQILIPANQFGMARHSQQREAQADAAALDTLHCHYGHVGGADEFFKALQRADKEHPPGLNHYFASHPALRARLAALEQRTAAQGYRGGATDSLPDWMRTTAAQARDAR